MLSTYKVLAVNAYQRNFGIIQIESPILDQPAFRERPGAVYGTKMATAELKSFAAGCLTKISQYHNQIDVGVVESASRNIFEVSLAVSSLLEADCPRDFFLDEENTLISTLREWVDHDNIAARLLPRTKTNIDVTAATITALNLLGQSTLPDRLLESFEDLAHTQPPSIESDDLATNCEVLISLLHVEKGIDRYGAQIERVATSVCSTWWAKSHEQVMNGRNICPLYSVMLVSKALATYAVAKSSTTNAKEGSLDDKISLMLTEVLVNLLRTQHADGSWGQKSNFEETSYAVLAIKYLTAFPFAKNFKDEIWGALTRAFNIFGRRTTERYIPAELWIGTSNFSSHLLSQGYFLSALGQPAWLDHPNMHRFGRSDLSSSSVKLSKLARNLPLLQGSETWEIKSCLLQGDFFARMLRASMPRIFPRENMRKETYLDLVPFTWATSRQFETLRLRNQELLDMMVLAVTIYQIDEFMEATVIQLDDSDMRKLDDIFENLCSEQLTIETNRPMKSGNESSSNKETSEKNLRAITKVLREYVQFVLQHPSVASGRPLLQRQLRSDIKRFLRSHLRQVKDNLLLRGNQMKTVESIHGSVFSWVRGTSADHTGGPFAMTYYLCLVEGRHNPPQPISTEGLYVAQMVSQHLAALCRTYNDWGSRARDMAEFNVNSLNFEEIRNNSEVPNCLKDNGAFINQQNGIVSMSGHGEPERRLLFIAEFERRCMLNCLRELKDIVNPEVYVAVKLFCDVTDIYGQIYVVKDMTPRLTEQK
ncbi:hypothetical protein F5B22DRAFT_620675 [Xylaria bambusicola]|uniref:uncharacterized protein n=1 Tax=Xylaria bambusicola TaxID=326684 RepID=UPI002007C396|nr:uncharacterized protein F5B22DRAFT_620675 [Xylaria bambusicola]KAI0508470.1 hypothetical protein F5B22DRAFT_620675 [Xylaria bambusicola]